jgi:prophage tail gpP-like protein
VSVSLRIHGPNGREYGGWKSVRVTRSMESLCGSFELSVSERWANQDQPWPIEEEDECAVIVDGKVAITGYVDAVRPSFSGFDESLNVAGRDRAGELVDCSAALGKWEYAGANLEKVARLLCEPFGIDVTLQAGLVASFTSKLTIDPGDTAFQVLEEACRLAGVVAISDGSGGLLLTRTGTARASTPLVSGVNVLSGSASYDSSERFRTYKVLGQQKGTDEVWGEAAAQVKGTATDDRVKRTWRTLVVRPEAAVTLEQAKTRAQWEAKVRAARGVSVSVTVPGWTQRDGTMWPINALVPVRVPQLRVNGEMLITEVTFGLDDSQGQTTDLTLRRPDAFTPEPVVKKTKEEQFLALRRGV